MLNSVKILQGVQKLLTLNLKGKNQWDVSTYLIIDSLLGHSAISHYF